MTNIYDYINWRKDITLSYDAFNEVDNIILSLLSYVEFDDIPNIDTTLLPIQTVTETYFAKYSDLQEENAEIYKQKMPFLLKKISDSSRFCDMKIGYYINYIDKNSVVQFSAITFDFPEFMYIAFRGTDNTFTGWKEDFYLSYVTGTNGQKAAATYLDQLFENSHKPIQLGGHSKGGNLAIYAACNCKKQIQDRITTIWSNDGPGFLQQMVDTPSYQKIQDRIRLIIPDSSIVGVLMNNVTPKVIQSDANGVMQHDATTWQVMQNHFVEAKLSNNSAFLNKAIDTWLSSVSEEEAKTAIDSVFSVLESTDVQTFNELSHKGFESTKDLMNAARNLSPDQYSLILKLFGNFISNSGNLLFQDYKDKAQNQIQQITDKLFKNEKHHS